MASKQPRRPDLTSHLKFMAQITYTTNLPCLLRLFGPSFELREMKKEEGTHLSLLELSASLQLKKTLCPTM